jgi:hypothetical protein
VEAEDLPLSGWFGGGKARVACRFPPGSSRFGRGTRVGSAKDCEPPIALESGPRGDLVEERLQSSAWSVQVRQRVSDGGVRR